MKTNTKIATIKLSQSDCEVIIEIMLDMWAGDLQELTREISNQYGLSMIKTLYVMKEFYATKFQSFYGHELDYTSNDGEDDFAKHTFWRML